MPDTNEVVGCVLPVRAVGPTDAYQKRIGGVYVVGNPRVEITNEVAVNLSHVVDVKVLNTDPAMLPPAQARNIYRIVTANGRDGRYYVDALTSSGWATVRNLGPDGRTPVDPHFDINLNLALEIHE